MRNFPQVPFFCIFAPQRICVAKHNAPCAAEWSGVRTGVAVWVGTHMCAKSGCPSFCVAEGKRCPYRVLPYDLERICRQKQIACPSAVAEGKRQPHEVLPVCGGNHMRAGRYAFILYEGRRTRKRLHCPKRICRLSHLFHFSCEISAYVGFCVAGCFRGRRLRGNKK